MAKVSKKMRQQACVRLGHGGRPWGERSFHSAGEEKTRNTSTPDERLGKKTAFSASMCMSSKQRETLP